MSLPDPADLITGPPHQKQQRHDGEQRRRHVTSGDLRSLGGYVPVRSWQNFASIAAHRPHDVRNDKSEANPRPQARHYPFAPIAAQEAESRRTSHRPERCQRIDEPRSIPAIQNMRYSPQR